MTEKEAVELELLFERSVSRMLDSDHFRSVLKSVVLECGVQWEEVAKMQLPQKLVACCLAHGVFLRVDEQGHLRGNDPKLPENVRKIVALYKDEVIRFLREYRPQAVSANGAAQTQGRKPSA